MSQCVFLRFAPTNPPAKPTSAVAREHPPERRNLCADLLRLAVFVCFRERVHHTRHARAPTAGHVRHASPNNRNFGNQSAEVRATECARGSGTPDHPCAPRGGTASKIEGAGGARKKKRHRKLQKQHKPDTEKPLVFIQCFKRHSTLLEWRHGALTATHRNETQTATRGRASQNNNGQQRAARAARRMRSTGTDAERSAQGVVRPCSAGFCWVDPWARAQIEKT